MEKLKYISFYNGCNEERIGSLAAMSKIDFIVENLVESGYFVNFISPSWITVKDNFFVKQKRCKYEHYDVLYTPSFGPKNKLFLFLSILTSIFWCFLYCIRNISKDEKIILYHTPWLALPVFLARKIKKFQIVLEVEEVYSDVKKMNSIIKKIEYFAFRNADSFILSNDLLAEKITSSKPYIVLYGNYKIYNKAVEEYNDDKIHLLYAGIIDHDKRGAFNALEAAKYLDDNYILHIVGSGETEILQEKIKEHNNKYPCKVIYDGVKKGLDYINYAQKCQVGLSTQKMSGDYLDTSFPSKIINYFGLGLNVVSGKIKCVERSAVQDLITFYNKDEPEEIALAIKKITFIRPENIKEKMHDIHNRFKNDLNLLLNR